MNGRDGTRDKRDKTHRKCKLATFLEECDHMITSPVRNAGGKRDWSVLVSSCTHDGYTRWTEEGNSTFVYESGVHKGVKQAPSSADLPMT